MATATATYASSRNVSRHQASSSCSNCGAPYPDGDSRRRIEELESQVRILTDKATAAVDKLADYEDELRQLKSARNLTPSNSSVDSTSEPSQASSAFSIFGRKQSSNPNTTPPVPGARESDLQAALAQEQALRQKAEGKVTQMSGELEDLTGQLFQQANEMVATERKARAKLEERVETLEKRDVEKRKRLERLESALSRIEKVRGLLKS